VKNGDGLEPGSPCTGSARCGTWLVTDMMTSNLAQCFPLNKANNIEYKTRLSLVYHRGASGDLLIPMPELRCRFVWYRALTFQDTPRELDLCNFEDIEGGSEFEFFIGKNFIKRSVGSLLGSIIFKDATY
jgi:hypothetical protein